MYQRSSPSCLSRSASARRLGGLAFAAPLLLRRHGLYITWAMLAGVRILWHLPLMLTGQMPWLMGILGNAGFQLVLLLLVQAGGRWSLAAVWHASLNAFGGAFLFTMVSGADKDRLALFLGIAYAVLGVAWAVVERRRPGWQSQYWPETEEQAAEAGRLALAA